MAVRITGGEQLITSDMQRNFRDVTAAAKKQLTETGSLEGFAKEFTATSAQGTVTIEVSAMASALYDKAADGDDYLLAYKVTDKPHYSDGGVGISSGASETISDGADVDTFLANAERAFGLMRWATVVDGTPEELAAYDAAQRADLLAQPGVVQLQAAGGDAAPAKATDSEVDGKLKRAQTQSASANQLAAKLNAFLDDLKDASKAAAEDFARPTQDQSPVQSALRRLTQRVDLSA